MSRERRSYSGRAGDIIYNKDKYITERCVELFEHCYSLHSEDSDPAVSTTIHVKAATAQADPTSTSWDGKCNDVSAYPTCEHNIGSTLDTCVVITLLQISDHTQELSCISSGGRQGLSSLRGFYCNDGMINDQWCASFHHQSAWTWTDMHFHNRCIHAF